MQLAIPELSLVVLVGASGSGKSTFARRHFLPTEIISSDHCRALVADDETDQTATQAAFEIVHFIAGKRLDAGRLAVIDATSVQPEARKALVDLARRHHVLPVAIVFNLPERLCQARDAERTDRRVGPHIIHRQVDNLRRSLRGLQREGFRQTYFFKSQEEVDAATITRQRLWTNRKDEHGPFDIIGDIHGCYDELRALLGQLGYEPSSEFGFAHPEQRRVIFLGDLVDRGPRTPDVLKTVMAMMESGAALCVPGNHDVKLMKKLRGRDVKIAHGLAESLKQLEAEPPEFHKQAADFIDALVSHFVLDDGKLVVAHAGLKESLQGRSSARVRDFALYGETTGETDEFGLPVRFDWASEYRGRAAVVYGHTPVPEAEWVNNTICIDTGCVYGGRLTALRYPERELVAVPARQVYYESIKPFLAASTEATTLTAQQQHDDVLDLDDVLGRRLIETRLLRKVAVREENAVAALEVMSRFAANPKWLVYLPPTMSPCATSREPNLLEHPAEAFAYYREEGVAQVICEEKHMGSRAVVIVCRDEAAAARTFGVTDEGIGIVYTRTGRRFFDDAKLEAEFLARLRAATDASGLWEELQTDWLCLDCELMPWSAKAQELLKRQYAAVGAAAGAALPDAVVALARAEARGVEVGELLARFNARAEMIGDYVAAYRRYCWPVASLDDLQLAPFHLLASAGAVHTDKDHVWHMETLRRLCAADPQLLLATPYRLVDVNEEGSVQAGVDWWMELTGSGGEGMVVKPLVFIARGGKWLAQPAVKCRGREYLRIIYGPEYTAPEHLERLRARGLGAKRALALREFALGVEALERFVAGQPLRRVHECVFGVLAMESEPVDPRL